MISVTPSTPKFGALNHRPIVGLMLGSNCIHRLPHRPILPTSTPGFRASKFTSASPFPSALSFRVIDAHHRFSSKHYNRNISVGYGGCILGLMGFIRLSNAGKEIMISPEDHNFNIWNDDRREYASLSLIGEDKFLKWKISCFRHEELPSGSPKSRSAEEILHELDKVEIKPNVERRNWATSLREVLDTFFGEIGKPWTVPWTAETILQVTLLWIISFWFVGSWMIPFGAHTLGISKDSLTFRGQALFSLLTDVTEGLAGILILHCCLSRFRPLPSEWFRFSLRGKWIFDVFLGCLMFPLVNRLSQFNLNLLPVLQSTPFTLSSVEQSIMARDPIAMALYALVLVVCAPLWEEIVFREDVTTDSSWGCDGGIVCKVKEPIAIDAPAQPVERLRILGFNEMKFFFLVKSISSKLETQRFTETAIYWL
ncbi:UNVERIFIED_CONTAM: hypothetical protein Sindi_1247000 [Sesamum indicum]